MDNDGIMPRRSIEEHILWIAVVPAAIVALGLVFYFVALRYGDADAALVGRGLALARQMAATAERGVQDRDGLELARLASAATRQEDVIGIGIVDKSGRLLASAGTDLPVATDNEGCGGRSNDGRALFCHASIRSAEGAIGKVTIAVPLAAVAARKHEILAVTLLAAFALLAAAAALARRLARKIAAPARELELALEKLRAGHYETRLSVHPDCALSTIAAGVNQLAETLTDARHKTVDRLAEREDEFARQLNFAQAMLDAQAQSGIGLAIIENGQITFANEAVSRISGYRQDELQAMNHFVQIAHPNDREVIMRNYLKRQCGERFEDRYDFVLLRKDGAIRHVQLAQTTLTAGNHFRVLGILLDVSEQKQAEAQLAETHRQLLARRVEAEHSNFAKSRFLAAASHDLRQPLHALMLFAAEFETVAATSDQKRLAGQITAATGAMGELLDAMLEVSRLDIKDITPQPYPHALGPLLESVADAHRHSAEAKNLRLTCVPTTAWANSDPHLLRRLVGNLVANAVRYTHHGGVVIGVRREGAGLRIEVWDSGIGIDAEHLPHIFQEFYQVGNVERDSGKGLGLGLAIVDRLARMLGSRLHVRSEWQRGSMFGVSVARAAPALEAAASIPEIPAHAARILVADAAPPELASLGNLLETWGYRVLRAGSAKLLRTHMAAMPDIVVCDENFIDDVVQALAGRPRPRPRVVMIGDVLGKPPQQLFLDGRLSKPLKPGRLRALLHHLFEETAERAKQP